MTAPVTAGAQGFSITLEPGVAVPLTVPQSELYEVGAGQSLKALFGLTPYLAVGPSASFLFLPDSAEGVESGVVWGLGGGLRLARPHDRVSFAGVSPWLDADALYVRTGDLHRPGFDVAAGVAVPIGAERNYWIGPFVRYLHVVQPERAGFDNSDAKILSLGVSVEFGSGRERKVASLETHVVNTVETRDVVSCPDGDADGAPDSIDRCPEVVGVTENWGCPPYKAIAVKPDKLELKEKLYFAWNKATLEEASFPVLDEVAQALKDNKGFRVQVDGHSDSSGANDHNQTLSEHRAEAVVEYLVAHGVERNRLVSKGFSSSVPTDDNQTVDGRENNRRVEFVVHFIILNDGASK